MPSTQPKPVTRLGPIRNIEAYMRLIAGKRLPGVISQLQGWALFYSKMRPRSKGPEYANQDTFACNSNPILNAETQHARLAS